MRKSNEKDDKKYPAAADDKPVKKQPVKSKTEKKSSGKTVSKSAKKAG